VTLGILCSPLEVFTCRTGATPMAVIPNSSCEPHAMPSAGDKLLIRFNKSRRTGCRPKPPQRQNCRPAADFAGPFTPR
jgi:hypothetical protein